MNKEIKQKWIEKLTDGSYTQGKGCLRTREDQFCCLGVLCDILEPNAWQRGSEVPGSARWWTFGGGSQSYMPPQEIIEQCEFTENELTKMDFLADYNDDDPAWPFKAIAYYIEKEF